MALVRGTAHEPDQDAYMLLPRPRFLIRISDFTIVEYSQPKIKADVDQNGYGIISYTWGRFQDKTKRETSSSSPRFDTSIPDDMHWHFPKLKANSFTMDMVRHVLEILGTKYAWWDWACIPQFWDSGNTPDTSNPAGPVIGFLKSEYKCIKDEEIAKQLFIYTLAKRGFIWLHDTVWTQNDKRQTSPSYLEQLLMRERSMLPNDYVALLQQVKETENWFSSMWTFQEGILLNTDQVIDPRLGKLVLQRDQKDCAILLDRNGKTLCSDNFFRGGTATMIDITGRVTFQACNIASRFTDASVDRTSTGERGFLDLQRLMREFHESGFVSYMADSPLLILESSRARGSNFTAPADYCVNALLGALQVVLPDHTPRDNLEIMKLALMATLIERYNWRMVLLSKPTQGLINPQFIDRGRGDWISILDTSWQFSALGPFISTTLGSLRPQRASDPNQITLPPLIHAHALDPHSEVDVLIVGPDPPSQHPYKIFLFDSITSSRGWKTCRFYKSVRNTHSTQARGKQFQCVVTTVVYERAGEELGTGSIALLPLEKGFDSQRCVDEDDTIVRCVILSKFMIREVKGSKVGCGIFVGIGDFTFSNDDEISVAATDVLGSSDWKIYMY